MESNKSIDLIIEGMHCAGCVSTVEKALKGVQGVQSAVVNLILEKATIKGEPDFETLTEAVKSAGYGVVNIDGSQLKTNLKAALILPDGKPNTPTFLVFSNYEKILRWNRSLRFGISVCTLAEMIKI